jgi:hypothetical protein
MVKNNVAETSTALQENPTVLIRYEPENALAVLAGNTTKMLARLTGAKITNPKTLESASELIHQAQITSDEVETFIDTLREKIQNAAARFREYEGFEDFEVTLTVRRWGLRKLLTTGISKLKNARAQFLADEQERVRREQLTKQAEQDRLNKLAADKAAAEAKKQGADKATVAEIKQAVLAVPAPIVTSKAAEVAQAAGASVRYAYYARITDLKKFLGTCLNNEVLFNTLKVAIPDIEAAFRKMASDQKESFSYAGLTFEKKPVDVGRRA